MTTTLTEEIDRLEQKIEEAYRSKEEARASLDAIKARRQDLSLAAFDNEEAAKEELTQLRVAQIDTEESLVIMDAAIDRLSKQLQEAREKEAEVLREQSRARFEELKAERDALDKEIEKRVDALLKSLKKEHPLRSAMIEEARTFDEETGDFLARNDKPSRRKRWLKGRLNAYLL